MANKLKTYALQDVGLNTIEANNILGFPADTRDYWLAVQILKRLNVNKIKLMTNNPAKITAFSNSNIKVIERIPLKGISYPENKNYLDTKKKEFKHYL